MSQPVETARHLIPLAIDICWLPCVPCFGSLAPSEFIEKLQVGCGIPTCVPELQAPNLVRSWIFLHVQVAIG